MEQQKYTVRVVIAAPGTPLYDKNGNRLLDADLKPDSSGPGHMFYVLQAGSGKQESYGFAPIKSRDINGPGEPKKTDLSEYKDPVYSRTMEISKSQYERLRNFGEDPKSFGFDLHYKDARNNCVDFTWAALNQAGIHRKSRLDLADALGPTQLGALAQQLPNMSYRREVDAEGKDGYRPYRNIDGVKSIDAPIPGSPLNREHTNPMPQRDKFQWSITESNPIPASPLTSSNEEKRISDARQQEHRDHPLDQKIRSAVAQAESSLGRNWDQNSEKVAANMTLLARQSGFSEKDDLTVSFSNATSTHAAGEHVLLQRSGQGASPDPYANRAHMKTEEVIASNVDRVYHSAAQSSPEGKVDVQQSSDAQQVAQSEAHKDQESAKQVQRHLS